MTFCWAIFFLLKNKNVFFSHLKTQKQIIASIFNRLRWGYQMLWSHYQYNDNWKKVDFKAISESLGHLFWWQTKITRFLFQKLKEIFLNVPYFLNQYPGKQIFLTSSNGETIGSFQNVMYWFWPYFEKRGETIQEGVIIQGRILIKEIRYTEK